MRAGSRADILGLGFQPLLFLHYYILQPIDFPALRCRFLFQISLSMPLHYNYIYFHSDIAI